MTAQGPGGEAAGNEVLVLRSVCITVFQGHLNRVLMKNVESINQKTIVTALVIAQAGGGIMEMFAARRSLSIWSLFRALASITLVQRRRC
jgi:hypothetical protein